MRILVTGGAGFIGSHFVHYAHKQSHDLIVLDALTYASNIQSLDSIKEDIEFIEGDINDKALVTSLLETHHIDALVHFAAESHVDNSISGSDVFIQTNILGTYSLLECVRNYKNRTNKDIRMVHVSTDEVYGQLPLEGDAKFSEKSPYCPSSPYSASKAASDLLAYAWYHTYNLPLVITHCSNNYGPYQHDEKLIPTIIRRALNKEPVPIYGTGENIRDWIHVDDHVRGVYLALTKGKYGEHYCFGGREEHSNITLARKILTAMDQILSPARSYHDLITFVEDRPGHDLRYAIDDSKAQDHLGFAREYSLEQGLHQTIHWYINHYQGDHV